MEETNKPEKKRNKLLTIIIALFVGILIGIIFKSLKLPVPVPHDVAGVVGLVGMFLGSAIADAVLKLIQNSK